ncbi:GNAT family N-acetyltransferase [Maritimibacter sp. DP1N21-5]|uniref:GNAT family N-acetyltransferase n=1 Tax=Maritimibacter sp. DP1N21-5 TaxID=2836867 RepID=UPI001C43784B|nr:GNAT family N-acetyltransferase [Maritimibacter sp. DP1N21-5]MBV7408395.1 GNAT family N-acetyltransferase [Maritimibacter sp. DP1N21-5]
MTQPLPLPDARRLIDAVLATWPAASVQHVGAWTIREGQNGGSRVSSATEDWPVTEVDLPAAEAAMRSFGQVPQIMVRDHEDKLDHLLETHGYAIKDPTNLYVIEAKLLAGDGKLPMGGGFAMWPPLGLIRDIFADGQIDAARQAVMERCPHPKTAMIERAGDYPGGAAFVAIDGDIAMVHALHVLPDARRKGVARRLLKRAAIWGLDHGAQMVGLAVTKGNHAANPLYASLGMSLRGQYHYRIKEE